jgi:phosphatidylglycerophosphatase C
MRLVLFDFDGTITRSDSFFDFLIYTFGVVRFSLGFAALMPVLAGYAAGMVPNWKAKEAVLRKFLKGWDRRTFGEAAERYSHNRLPLIIRDCALERIEWHRSRGHRMVVVSASVEEWMAGWCGRYGLEVIGTRLEARRDLLTGRIDGANCQGAEKVRRIREAIKLEEYEYIYAYGNTSGDTEMLELADERYYNWVKIT